MLLPAILQILDKSQVQSKRVVQNVESGFAAEMTAAADGMFDPEKTDSSSKCAADTVKPLNLDPPAPEAPQARQGLEELLRTITKFQKPNQKRVVDVFE